VSPRALMVERLRRPLTEYRADTPDGRRFRARVLLYDVLDDYRTHFAPGQWTAQLEAGDYPPLLYGHDWMSLAAVLGRAIDHADTRTSLDLVYRLDVEENAQARQAAGQLKSGTLREFSIGFTRTADEPSTLFDGATRITASFLDETSIVPRGAVPGTQLVSMRRADHDRLMAMAPEARARALAAHVVGPGQVPVEVGRQVILELGAGLYGLDEALRRLRRAAILPALRLDLEAEVRSALETVDRHRPRGGSEGAAEREASEALEALEDRDWGA
jgi:HK97 family phage prohead protease